MRRVLKLIPLVFAAVACSKTETPANVAAVDTGMAPAAAPAAAPAVTEADVAGTWKGTSTPMGSDSVISKWTQVCAAGTCTGTAEGSKTKVVSSYTLAGDSAVGASQPNSNPAFKGGKIIDTWVVHFMGDNATGTGAMKLASKPDSVVMTYKFSGTRSH